MEPTERAEQAPRDTILQHLTGIQATLLRIEEWLARLADARVSPPAAERPPKLLAQEAVCHLLGVSPDALYRRMRRGKFPRPTYGTGKRALWREEDVFGGRR